MDDMQHLMRTHGFIHIPKTGGTSIESRLNATLAIIKRPRKRSGMPKASPWHLPPDVYEALSHDKYTRPSFCVVREPRERLKSCFDWPFSQAFHTPLAQLARAFENGRMRVQWTEERVHRMPQSWFVWSDRGSVLCDCVIAYEKLAPVMPVHRNVARPQRVRNQSNYTFPSLLYEMDALLHRTALQSPSLCYSPPPLWP